MADEHHPEHPEHAGAPEDVENPADTENPDSAGTDDDPDPEEPGADPPAQPHPAPPGAAPLVGVGARQWWGRALTAVLIGLLGFGITIQVRHVADHPAETAYSQEDLGRILFNLETHERRLREEIAELEESQRALTTAGRREEEALAQATERADELAILAGIVPVTGPGIVATFHGEATTAVTLLDAVQELRSAGAEAIQIAGRDATTVRVVVNTYFLDLDGGIVIDGTTLHQPYTLTAIGDPPTLLPALLIPSGVVESVERDGGRVTLHEEPGGVLVSAVREPTSPQHAQPGS